MSLSAHDALLYLMVVTASSDSAMSDLELKRIKGLIKRLPVFENYDLEHLPRVANECVDCINGAQGLDGVLDMALGALPKRLQDTAYALAVDIASVDLKLEQEELRFLEMLRDKLDLDRLTTAAIEAAARARYRKA